MFTIESSKCWWLRCDVYILNDKLSIGTLKEILGQTNIQSDDNNREKNEKIFHLQ